MRVIINVDVIINIDVNNEIFQSKDIARRSFTYTR